MVIEIIALLLLVMAIYKGWTQGLIMSIFSFLSYFIAILLAFYFSAKVAAYFKESAGSDSKWYSFLAFFTVMIAAVIVIRIIGKMVEKAAELMLLGLVNKLAGIAIFGFLYFGLMSVVFVYLVRYQIVSSQFLSESKVGNYCIPFGNWVILHFGEWFPDVKVLFKSSKEFIEQKGESLAS